MTQNQYKNPLLYLDTMVDAIEHMLRYAKGKDFADYEKDSQLSDAIHMRLQVLGESASKLDIDFRDEHPHICLVRNTCTSQCDCSRLCFC